VNLAELLQRQADAQPNAVALRAPGRGHRDWRFGELADAAARAGTLLRCHGLAPGNRLLLFHPMAASLYVALGALFHQGLTAIFIDPAMGRTHIERCAALAKPDGLLATPKAHLLRLVSPTIRSIPIKYSTGGWLPGARRWAKWQECPPAAAVQVTTSTPALATFTSGSTGAPKLAIRTHGLLAAQHAALEATLKLAPGDVVLTTLPIFVLSHIAAGISTLLPAVDLRRPGEVNAPALLRQVREEGVTCLEGSPVFVERLAAASVAAGQPLRGVRRVLMGGGPVFLDIMELAQEAAPAATVTAVYGSTEAEPIAHLDLEEITQADRLCMAEGGGLLAGRPVAQVTVALLPDRWDCPLGPYSAAEFAAQQLPPGQVGEIVVQGEHVLPGYWQGVGDAENKIQCDGKIWHRTGDAGYFDAQGRLWLLGRCSAKISDARGTLYPLAVEAAVRRWPQVRRSALVAHAGRRVLALEIAGGEAQQLAATIRQALAWAQIDVTQVLPRLPVDPRHNAKIDYPALQRLLGGG
jgi:olefin beta-lactone synthetase